MNDTRTIFCRHIITGNHLEGITHRFDGGHQLLIFHADEIGSLVATYNTIGNEFLTFVIFRHFTAVSNLTLGSQIGIQTCFGHHHGDLLCSIGIIGLNSHIVNLRTYAEGRVGCKRPWCCRPGQEIGCPPLCHLRFRVLHLKLCRTSGVFDIPVTAGLIQLV